MAGKMPPRLSSIGGALILVCLFGAFSLPQAIFDSRAEGAPHDSIRYAKQIIWDLSPLPNRTLRFRITAPVRTADLFHGVAQSSYQPPLPPSSVINFSFAELPNLQSFAVFNPTTRSPPM